MKTSSAIQSFIAKHDKWCQKRSQTTNSHLIDTIDTKNSSFDNPEITNPSKRPRKC